jgi:hypothetical protein
MNKFVTGALALAAASSVGMAEPADSNEWLELDSEITGLGSSYSSAQDSTGWTALIRTTYTYSTDDIGTGGGRDISGFKFEDVDLAFWGGVGDYSWRISWDVGGGSGLDLEDAYVDWDCGEYFTSRMGMYKPRVLMSGSVDPENQLFIDRTAFGSAFDWWDTGVGGMGSYSTIDWYASIQNGDGAFGGGQTSGHRYSVRGEYHLGTGAAMKETALGANDDLNATFGLTYYGDDTVRGATSGEKGASMFALDGRGTAGPIGFGAEIGFLSDELAENLNTAGDFSRGAAFPLNFGDGDDDTTPFSLWASYLLNQEFEGGLRYEDLSNADDESVLSVVVNYYLSGNNLKWQGQWSNYSSDQEDGNIFQVGLVVGASR